MRNPLNLAGKPAQDPVVGRQGVAPAEDDLVDALVRCQLRQGVLPAGAAELVIPVGKVAPEAVPAVDGAGAGHHQQGPGLVFVDQATVGAGGRIREFGQGVRHITRGWLGFRGLWHDLTQQRVPWIAWLNATQVGLRDADGEVPMTGFHARDQGLRKRQPLAELPGRRDGAGQDFLPAGFLVVNPGFDRGLGWLYHWPPTLIGNPSEESMATYSTNEFRGGLKVMLDGDPCAILENEFVKPGKGQAFNRVKLRNLKTNRTWERTFKSGESLEAADVLELDMEYVYSDGEFWHFMKTDGSYEQFAADERAVGDAVKWLKEQDVYTVTLYNGSPLNVTPPAFVELEVVDTDPGVKGDTAQGGSKPATLSTGAVVNVPLFIEIGEVLRVDTRKNEYVARAKSG